MRQSRQHSDMSASTKQLAKTLSKCGPLFQALGEPARQKIILLLSDVQDMNVGDIALKVELSRPAVSHHLKVLRQADLVAVRKVGTENYYALKVEDALALLTRFVAEVHECA
jgi:ArsR family transcriptional regulator, arsenate/arsenite/antimonite-responsive transcriptional repressor